MKLSPDFIDTLVLAARIAAIAALIALIFWYLNRRLVAYYTDRPHQKFRRQLLQIGGLLIAILVVIVAMPFGDAMRGQLLSLYGIIISATIALSSTTLVGNVMAGLMLKMIGNLKPGNYVTIGDYFGRISEMDLLHTEIQTEERDLTTLPNLYLVTHPVRVMRASGTLLSVSVSLGYDVSRHSVEKLMLQAANDSGLEKPYVQITELGDFSVTYQVSGLLTDVGKIITRRRELRARTMDALHDADIEIVSPTFMNTRAYDEDAVFIAETADCEPVAAEATSPDAIAFDKAERAESVTKLRKKVEEAQARIRTCNELVANPPNDQAKEAAEAEIEALNERLERLNSIINRKEAKISNDE